MSNVAGNLYFTIGLARSGKSTYCNRWRDFCEGDEESWTERPRAIVCGDDIRLALHGDRFNRHAEPMVWAIHTYAVKSLLLRGHDVIIDGTNTTKESIYRILSIDPTARYVLFDTPVEECEKRALACGHDDLVTKGVIGRQARQLQSLMSIGLEETLDEIREKVRKRWQI